ncbi:hypothetical protein [Kitasatospora sp. MBT66]|uniref:hypothetical protein n=1 Tax=Kitasatospora sp. MBT66 TaxID=1444769 RepID=UPI0005B9A612|nr:hypothetical protein [Kitasatospora sp. MBT66]
MDYTLSLKGRRAVELLARLKEAEESLRMFNDPTNENVMVASEHRAASMEFLNGNVYMQLLEALEVVKTAMVVDYGPVAFKETEQSHTWHATGMPDGLWTLSKRFFHLRDNTVTQYDKGSFHLYDTGGSYVQSFTNKSAAKKWLELRREQMK